MKLINGFKFAIRGLTIAIREQRNMKVHLLAIAAITTIGICLNFNYMDWCIVLLSVGLVIGMELINTSIEEIVNFISPEKRTEAGRMKDLAAGAVLLVSLAVLLVGVMLILSKVYW